MPNASAIAPKFFVVFRRDRTDEWGARGQRNFFLFLFSLLVSAPRTHTPAPGDACPEPGEAGGGYLVLNSEKNIQDPSTGIAKAMKTLQPSGGSKSEREFKKNYNEALEI